MHQVDTNYQHVPPAACKHSVVARSEGGREGGGKEREREREQEQIFSWATVIYHRHWINPQKMCQKQIEGGMGSCLY